MLSLFLISMKFIPELDSEKNGYLTKANPVESVHVFMKYKLEVFLGIISLISNLLLVAFSSVIIPYHIGTVLRMEPVYVGVVELSLSIGALLSVSFFKKLCQV